MDKKELQQEDTVSADRKAQIVFDPDAWNKNDRSGKKIVSIASRQNFNNAKFTRRKNKGYGDEEQVEESKLQEITQNTGSSGIDLGVTEPSTSSKTPTDQGSTEPKKKKQNSQIEFCNGTEAADGASTTTGDQHSTNTRGKIGESIVIKALKQIKTNKNTGTEDMADDNVPFDKPYNKVKKQKNSDGSETSPMSKARQLAKKAIENAKMKKEGYDSAAAYKDQYPITGGDTNPGRGALRKIGVEPSGKKIGSVDPVRDKSNTKPKDWQPHWGIQGAPLKKEEVEQDAEQIDEIAPLVGAAVGAASGMIAGAAKKAIDAKKTIDTNKAKAQSSQFPKEVPSDGGPDGGGTPPSYTTKNGTNYKNGKAIGPVSDPDGGSAVKEETEAEKHARHSKDLDDLERSIHASGSMDKETQAHIDATRKDLAMKKANMKEETKGDANRQINYFKFMQRLKRAGLNPAAAVQAEETVMTEEDLKTIEFKSFVDYINESDDDDNEDMDAGNASKAVKETPKHERTDKDAKQEPAKYDAEAARKRKAIEAHQEKMRAKKDDLGW